MTSRHAPAATEAAAAHGQRPAPGGSVPGGSVRLGSAPGGSAPGGRVRLRRRWLLDWSIVLALLVLVSSVAGLVDPRIYEQETANWVLQAKGQDVGNLLAVVVLLVAAVRYAQGSSRAAGRVWLGTVLYLVYAFVIYAMAVHLNQLFLVYVAVLGVSGWAILIHAPDLRRDAEGQWPGGRARRWAAGVLVGIGVLFAALWLSELVPAAVTGEPPASLGEAGLWVNPVHVIDLSMVLPAFVVTGVAALRGREAGLFWLGPWLVFSVLMGSSIVAASVLMMASGAAEAVVPAVMVSVVVLASLAAAWAYLRPRGEPEGAARP